MDTYNEPPLTKEQKQERVYNLTVEQKDLEAKKKSTNKAYNEELKRLKQEIKELLQEDRQTLDVI